jgi:hypothetical protein
MDVSNTMLPRDFGEGWITDSGRDLAKIAVALAGFDGAELARRLMRVRMRGSRINARTVDRVLGEMWQHEHRRRTQSIGCAPGDPADDERAGEVEAPSACAGFAGA